MNFYTITTNPETVQEQSFFDYITNRFEGKKLPKCIAKRIIDAIAMLPEINPSEYE